MESNWRDLKAGKELDQVIAEVLGYHDFEVSGLTRLLWGWREATDDDPPYHVHDGKIQECISDYSKDTDAALYHLKVKNRQIVLVESGAGFYAFYNPLPLSYAEAVKLERPAIVTAYPNASMAICYAFLEMAEQAHG